MILTVCQRGNVRAVTAAIILKDYCGLKDVVPLGMDTTTIGFLMKMLDQAEQTFYFVDATLLKTAPRSIHLDVGDDIWGQPMHPELVWKIIVQLTLHTNLMKDHQSMYGSVEAYCQANEAAYIRRIGEYA